MKVQTWCQAIAGTLTLSLGATALAGDWPMWGGTPERNMVSHTDAPMPTDWDPGEFKPRSDEIDPDTLSDNIRWVAKLGSQTYGNPSVADGRVFVGTNNDGRDDERFVGDYSLLYAFDEQTGEVDWILTVPKIGAGKVGDWEYLGICSSAAVDGDRVYIVTTRCEVLCLDISGLENGNTGPYTDEGAYYANLDTDDPPVELKATDADIIWRYDMREELGVFPHNTTSSSPMVIGDKVYASTSNGVDWGHTNIPNPRAPIFIALDKYTGELVGEEASQISTRILHGAWSSPTYGEVDGEGIVFYGGPDGKLYGFDPEPVPDEHGFGLFPEHWRYDLNPEHYRYREDGTPIRYARPDGPSEVIGTPVFYDGKVYTTIGQDPEHGEGIGNIAAVDAATGEKVWEFNDIYRSMSTPSIVDDLLFVADFSGFIYCLDAQTGEKYWKYDSMSHIWGSTFVADDKVYIANEDGDVIIFAADKEKEVINVINMRDPIYSSPIAANGALYIATQTQLYVIEPQD